MSEDMGLNSSFPLLFNHKLTELNTIKGHSEQFYLLPRTKLFQIKFSRGTTSFILIN